MDNAVVLDLLLSISLVPRDLAQMGCSSKAPATWSGWTGARPPWPGPT